MYIYDVFDPKFLAGGAPRAHGQALPVRAPEVERRSCGFAARESSQFKCGRGRGPFPN